MAAETKSIRAENWKRYRLLSTSLGNLVVCGKNAEQNEEVVKKFMGKDNLIIHTKEAGSPFCILLDKPKKPGKKDLHETAIFCAKYSRDFKKNKRDVEVHAFIGKDVYKGKSMKAGTFGVRKIRSRIKVKKQEIENFNYQTC